MDPSGKCNDYPSQPYQTPRPSPRKRSKNVTHSNQSPKKKFRGANDKDSLNVPDSIGGDSQEQPAGSHLVQGSANQSRDQDGRARDEGTSPARDEVGRYSMGTKRMQDPGMPDSIGGDSEATVVSL